MMNGIRLVISECVKHTIEISWFIFFIGIYVNYKVILITAVYQQLNIESESGIDLGGVCTYAPMTASSHIVVFFIRHLFIKVLWGTLRPGLGLFCLKAFLIIAMTLRLAG